MMNSETDKAFKMNTHHVPLSQIVPEIRLEKREVVRREEKEGVRRGELVGLGP